MNQGIVSRLRGYRRTLGTVTRLVFCRQMAVHRLVAVPVNLAAYLFNRPPLLLPPVLQIDITDMCNLKCPGCLTGMGYNKHARGMMPLAAFTSLIDDVVRSTALVVLYNSGEPLLHPDAISMIRYLTDHGIASIVSTNGHFIKTREQAEELVSAGLSVMVVSLSGTSQSVYEQYHQKGRLDQVLAGVRHVKAARARLNKKMPLIIFRFLVMEHNRHQIKAMDALAKQAGCDGLEFREVNWRACLIDNPSAFRQHQVPPPGQKTIRRCLWPWLISVVNWNGDVYPCCFYRLNLPSMGNTGDPGKMTKIWKNSSYNRFRKDIKSGLNCPAACHDCPAEAGFQTRFSRRKRTIYLDNR